MTYACSVLPSTYRNQHYMSSEATKLILMQVYYGECAARVHITFSLLVSISCRSGLLQTWRLGHALVRVCVWGGCLRGVYVQVVGKCCRCCCLVP